MASTVPMKTISLAATSWHTGNVSWHLQANAEMGKRTQRRAAPRMTHDSVDGES